MSNFFVLSGIKFQRKRSLSISFIFSSLIFFSAANQLVKSSSKEIVAVEPLVCDLVKAIVPPSQPVECLIDRSKDLHSIKISPSQAKSLSEANQIFTLGAEMTPSIRQWQNNPRTLVLGVSAIFNEEHNDHTETNHNEEHNDHSEMNHNEEHNDYSEINHDHHHGGGLDPHVWHDPNNIIKIANLIYEHINKNDTLKSNQNKEALNERFITVKSILEDLNQWNKRQVAKIPTDQKTIVSKHKAMDYFANAYGLKTISLLDFLGHSSSLRPRTISKVFSELEKNNVQVIFPEQSPPSKLLRNLSRQTSKPLAKEIIYVDGLMPKGNLISTAIHNTCTIVDSLGGKCNKKEGMKIKNRWDSLN